MIRGVNRVPGQTIGKTIVGTRVVNIGSAPLQPWQAVARFLVRARLSYRHDLAVARAHLAQFSRGQGLGVGRATP